MSIRNVECGGGFDKVNFPGQSAGREILLRSEVNDGVTGAELLQ